MPESCFELWTWQGPDFSLTTGTVDHRKSCYYDDPSFPDVAPAYHKLWRRLGTTQIIWCYPRHGEHHHISGISEVEWELEVPESEILAVIHPYVWNRITGTGRTFPECLHGRWRLDSIQHRPNREQYVRDREVEYEAAIARGGWWTNLFLPRESASGGDVLLRHPLEEAWIRGRTLHD